MFPKNVNYMDFLTLGLTVLNVIPLRDLEACPLAEEFVLYKSGHLGPDLVPNVLFCS